MVPVICFCRSKPVKLDVMFFFKKRGAGMNALEEESCGKGEEHTDEDFPISMLPLFRSFENILEFCSGLLKGVLKLGFPVGQNGFLSGLADGLDLDRQLC